ncbi:ankyrin repeat and protein kinase domain-containing protein 1-like [Plakobranchus ocellatus]|uniref:Ankyrin repeat and protein kinase domain-containing protein 1-like n=1 Tax=Plakobranchus ocellatus TaxID=259542 RepID=A0AAV3Z630_9GAST|nr:ankyrin repeat and protein kinase domain-containing protein 1-like [Plakobranchus ocellatus]
MYIWHNYINVMKKHNKSCSTKGSNGNPLHRLSTSTQMTLAIRICDETWVKSLLSSPDEEFDIHCGNYICQAAEVGHVGIMVELLAAGADPNEQNFYSDKWPVHICADYGHFETLQVLASHGADINQPDHLQRTAMHFVALRGHDHMVKWMVEHGALADGVESDGYSPLHTASCLDYELVCRHLVTLGGADVNRKSKDGWSPLHMAVSFGNLHSAKVLLSFGAGPGEKTLEGETALHMACAKDYNDLVQILLDYGALIECTNNQGETPLHNAIYYGHRNIVHKLIMAGANVNFLNLPATSCPLSLAGLRGDNNLLQLLLAAGCVIPRSTASLLHHRRNISSCFRDDVSRFPTLKDLCMWKIRGLLAPDLQRKAPFLPLPKVLKKVLAFEHSKII